MMKLLLDENVPAKLKFRFLETNISAFTIRENNWTGKRNGELPQLMIVNDFTTFLTFDSSLSFQQNFRDYPIQVLVLVSKDNTYQTIMNSFDAILQKLSTMWVGAEALQLNNKKHYDT